MFKRILSNSICFNFFQNLSSQILSTHSIRHSFTRTHDLWFSLLATFASVFPLSLFRFLSWKYCIRPKKKTFTLAHQILSQNHHYAYTRYHFFTPFFNRSQIHSRDLHFRICEWRSFHMKILDSQMFEMKNHSFWVVWEILKKFSVDGFTFSKSFTTKNMSYVLSLIHTPTMKFASNQHDLASLNFSIPHDFTKFFWPPSILAYSLPFFISHHLSTSFISNLIHSFTFPIFTLSTNFCLLDF